MFETECLNAHNDYRMQHGVHPLKLNRKICKECKEWAKSLAAKGRMEHKPNIPYGENIFSCWSSNPNHVITGKQNKNCRNVPKILYYIDYYIFIQYLIQSKLDFLHLVNYLKKSI